MSAESANIGIAIKTPTDRNPKREEPLWEKSDSFRMGAAHC